MGSNNLLTFSCNNGIERIDVLGFYSISFKGDWPAPQKALLGQYFERAVGDMSVVTQGLAYQYFLAGLLLPDTCPIKEEIEASFLAGFAVIEELENVMSNDEDLEFRYEPVIDGDPGIIADTGNWGTGDTKVSAGYFMLTSGNQYRKLIHELVHTLDTASSDRFEHPAKDASKPSEIVQLIRNQGRAAVTAATDPYLREELFISPSQPKYNIGLLNGIMLDAWAEEGIGSDRIYDCCGGRSNLLRFFENRQG